MSNWYRVLDIPCRLLVGGVFIYAGGLKLLDQHAFAVVIEGYGLLPGALVEPVALLLPLAEVAAGIGLLFGVRWSLGAITAMMLLFIGVLAWGIHLGLDIDCGCFGPEDPEVAYKGLRTALRRDLLLLLPIGYLFWNGRQRRRQSTGHHGMRASGMSGFRNVLPRKEKN